LRRAGSSCRSPRTSRGGSGVRDEFSEGEGLGKVVVGTQAEAVDAILDPPGGGQHQDPRLRTVRDQLAADVITVDSRQVAVEHNYFITVDQCLL